MARTLSEIDWEINQLAQAVDYYEAAVYTVKFQSELNRYKRIIDELNDQIKTLEMEKLTSNEQQ